MTEKVLYPYFKSIIDMDQCAVVVCNLVHEIIYIRRLPKGTPNGAERRSWAEACWTATAPDPER